MVRGGASRDTRLGIGKSPGESDQTSSGQLAHWHASAGFRAARSHSSACALKRRAGNRPLRNRGYWSGGGFCRVSTRRSPASIRERFVACIVPVVRCWRLRSYAGCAAKPSGQLNALVKRLCGVFASHSNVPLSKSKVARDNWMCGLRDQPGATRPQHIHVRPTDCTNSLTVRQGHPSVHLAWQITGVRRASPAA